LYRLHKALYKPVRVVSICTCRWVAPFDNALSSNLSIFTGAVGTVTEAGRVKWIRI
jgi:hypothetical protein